MLRESRWCIRSNCSTKMVNEISFGLQEPQRSGKVKYRSLNKEKTTFLFTQWESNSLVVIFSPSSTAIITRKAPFFRSENKTNEAAHYMYDAGVKLQEHCNAPSILQWRFMLTEDIAQMVGPVYGIKTLAGYLMSYSV